MTLVEMLLALVLIALLAALAVPPFSRVIAARTVESHAQAFMADARHARLQALRRGIAVTLCRCDEPDSADPQCAATSAPGGWERGWIVFVDRNGDGRRQNGETLLRVQGALAGSGGIARAGSAAFNQLRYRASGWAMGAQVNLRFVPAARAAQADPELTRLVCISTVGRVRLAEPGVGTCALNS